MKASAAHDTHGLAGQIINRANGASLAFHFPKGKDSIPIEIHAAGQVVPGRLVLVRELAGTTDFDVSLVVDADARARDVKPRPAPEEGPPTVAPPAPSAPSEAGPLAAPSPSAGTEAVEVGDGTSAFGRGAVLAAPPSSPVVAPPTPSDELPPYPTPGDDGKAPGVFYVKDGLPPAPPPRPSAVSSEPPIMARDLDELRAEANRGWG